MEIEYYKFEDGTNAIDPFLDALDIKMRVKVLRTIGFLEEFGRFLREPYSKPLKDGIFELRTIQGNDIERILYFFFDGNKAVLTNGFTKKTRKTPKREIELAKDRRERYVRRKINERLQEKS